MHEEIEIYLFTSKTIAIVCTKFMLTLCGFDGLIVYNNYQ